MMKKKGVLLLGFFIVIINAFSVYAQETTQLDTAIFITILTIFALPAIILWIYQALAWMAVAKKTGTSGGAIAWIPIIGNSIVSAKVAKSSSWPLYAPFILIILMIISAYAQSAGSSATFFVITLILFILSMLLFTVYWFIWRFKSFEACGKSGAWIFFVFIPFVGFLIYWILLGIAGWSKQNGGGAVEITTTSEKATTPVPEAE